MPQIIEQDDTASDTSDLISRIMSWEAGEMDADTAADFFADLIKSGTAWHLQGVYGRTAQAYIDTGMISPEGDLIMYPDEYMEQFGE
jgi:hypothetical protein